MTFTHTVPPSTDEAAVNGNGLPTLEPDRSLTGQPLFLHINTEAQHHNDMDPELRAVWAEWRELHGDHALAIWHQARLVEAGRCIHCGKPLTSKESLRRGAGETCFARHRR